MSHIKEVQAQIHKDILREITGLEDEQEKYIVNIDDEVCYKNELYIVSEIIDKDWIMIEELSPEDGDPVQRKVKTSSVEKV